MFPSPCDTESQKMVSVASILLTLFLFTTIMGCNFAPSKSPVYTRAHQIQGIPPFRRPSQRIAHQQIFASPPKKYSNGRGKVSSVRLTKGRKGMGIWKGHLSGKGPVTVFLQYLDGSSVVSERLMGKVNLQGRKVPFRFESMLPRETHWQWAIKVAPSEIRTIK